MASQSGNEKEIVSKEQEDTSPSPADETQKDSNANPIESPHSEMETSTSQPNSALETVMSPETTELQQKSLKENTKEEKSSSEANEHPQKLGTETTQAQQKPNKDMASEILAKETTDAENKSGKEIVDTQEKPAKGLVEGQEKPDNEMHEIQENLVKDILEESIKESTVPQETPAKGIKEKSAMAIIEPKEMTSEETQDKPEKLIAEPIEMPVKETPELPDKEITDPKILPAKETPEKLAKEMAEPMKMPDKKTQEKSDVTEPEEKPDKKTQEESAKDIAKPQETPAKETQDKLAKMPGLPQDKLAKVPGLPPRPPKMISECNEKPAKEISGPNKESAKENSKPQEIADTTKPLGEKPVKKIDRPVAKPISEITEFKQMIANEASKKSHEKTLREAIEGAWGKLPLKKTLNETTKHAEGKSRVEALHPKLQFIESEDEPSGSEFEDMSTYDDYFDIMIIGKTGLGKTTTADKLLLANPSSKIYRPTQQDDKKKMGASSSKASGNVGPSQRRRRSQTNSHVAQVEDLSMWHISDEVGDIDMVEQRLKNLLYCRLSEKPHEEVNKLREESEVTKCCELLSNDTSKIRILDVPGFFSSKRIESNSSRDMLEGAQSIISNNLLTMRKILHIKAAYQFKFNRIVYFLPERGVLRSNSQTLQMELQMMETYFGRTIFECMLVVATHDRSAYKSFKGGSEQQLYSAKDFEKSNMYLLQGIRAVFTDLTLIPRPPLEFISYHSTCEELLNLIKGSNVVREGVKLTFNASTCARCQTVLKRVKPKIFQEEGVRSEHSDVITCRHPDIHEDIPYDDSSCHPMIVPRYSLLQRIFGGIAHVIMPIKYIKRKYPSFKNFEEVCMACGKTPGNIGCKQVNRLYRRKCRSCRHCRHCEYCSDKCRKNLEWIDCSKCKACKKCQKCIACKEGILVNHTDKVREKYKIKKEHI